MDVGEFIVPVPYVKQIKLASSQLLVVPQRRLLIVCRGMSPDAAAEQVVKDSGSCTTCIAIDFLPPKKPGKGVFKSIFRRKSIDTLSDEEKEYYEPDVMEELFDEGSAMLSESLSNEDKTRRRVTRRIQTRHDLGMTHSFVQAVKTRKMQWKEKDPQDLPT